MIFCNKVANVKFNFGVTGMQQGNYQNAGSFQNYPQDQYIRPQGGSMAQPGDFNQPYSPRSHYPPYVADNERYSYVQIKNIFIAIYKERKNSKLVF